jgi:hypothetical protein
MSHELNSDTHFNLVVVPKKLPSECRNTEALADLAGINAPNNASESTQPAIQLSDGAEERPNLVNSAFADFLVGIRLGDQPRQVDAYAILIRMARSAAMRTGYMRYSSFGDYEGVANNCLAQEVQKHRHLTAFEVAECCKAKRFAYLWKAFKCRFIDEMRKTERRGEQPLDDQSESHERIPSTSRDINALETRWNRESSAKQFLATAKLLPAGPAAISKLLAELLQNREQLLQITDPNLSDRACKTLFVEYVAKLREVGTQVVRRDVKQFRDRSDEPEYAHVLEILRNTNLHSSGRCDFCERNANVHS